MYRRRAGSAQPARGFTPSLMEANLFDMTNKYADVVTVAEALDYLNRFLLKN
jgi:hypothetical protein